MSEFESQNLLKEKENELMTLLEDYYNKKDHRDHNNNKLGIPEDYRCEYTTFIRRLINNSDLADLSIENFKEFLIDLAKKGDPFFDPEEGSSDEEYVDAGILTLLSRLDEIPQHYYDYDPNISNLVNEFNNFINEKKKNEKLPNQHRKSKEK